MKISVALRTYNGAEYLPEQLASLAAQTRPPDELIVADDASSDDSVALVQAFARTVAFPVRIFVNERNKGFVANFETLVARCSGDVIATCDDDDVWYPEKLARAETILSDDPGVGLVCSDAEVVDAQLAPKGVSMWQMIEFSPAERAAVASGGAVGVLFRHNFVMGATMTFRASLLERRSPTPSAWTEDWWLAVHAALYSRLALIDEPLISYRQHPGNSVGAPKNATARVVERLRRLAEPRTPYFTAVLERWPASAERILELAAAGDTLLRPADEAEIRRKLSHIRTRAGLDSARWRRVGPVSAGVLRGDYQRYGGGFGTALKDLLVPLPGPSANEDPPEQPSGDKLPD